MFRRRSGAMRRWSVEKPSNDGEGASKISDGYLKKGTDAFLATVRPQS